MEGISGKLYKASTLLFDGSIFKRSFSAPKDHLMLINEERQDESNSRVPSILEETTLGDYYKLHNDNDNNNIYNINKQLGEHTLENVQSAAATLYVNDNEPTSTVTETSGSGGGGGTGASDNNEALNIFNSVAYNNLSRNEQDMIVNVTREYPFDYATIMFGYIMPFVLIITLITNTLVVMVLAQRHMRTPTNIVLFTMAIVDLMTLLSPSPWYFYIYTLGYHDRFLHPPSACYAHHIMTDVIPVFFHTSSIWLALLLASQRYIYVCHPTLASTWCTVPRVRRAILIILLIALLHQLTRFFDNTYVSISIQYEHGYHLACKNEISEWVQKIDIGLYFSTYFTFRILFVFIIPCVALITLNCLLFRALKRAKNKRTELLMKDCSYNISHTTINNNNNNNSNTNIISNNNNSTINLNRNTNNNGNNKDTNKRAINNRDKNKNKSNMFKSSDRASLKSCDYLSTTGCMTTGCARTETTSLINNRENKRNQSEANLKTNSSSISNISKENINLPKTTTTVRLESSTNNSNQSSNNTNLNINFCEHSNDSVTPNTDSENEEYSATTSSITPPDDDNSPSIAQQLNSSTSGCWQFQLKHQQQEQQQQQQEQQQRILEQGPSPPLQTSQQSQQHHLQPISTSTTLATSSSASLRNLDSNRTTLMLIVVVTVFLMVEVPVAIVTIIHVVLNLFDRFEDVEYGMLNYIKLFTNFIIMISYSVNFTIYCSMSKKFRETFKDLFLFGNKAKKRHARQQQQLHQQQHQTTRGELDVGGTYSTRGRSIPMIIFI